MLGLAIVSVAILVTVHGVAGPQLSRAYNLKGIAFHLKELQDQGYAIAHLGKYHGQYNFLGRFYNIYSPSKASLRHPIQQQR